MKKIIVIVLTLVAFAGLTTLGFAQDAKYKTHKLAKKNLEFIKGKIASIDLSKNEIVVKDNDTGTDHPIIVSAKVAAKLKTGDNVKVGLKTGTNEAETVKIMTDTGKSSTKSHMKK